MGIDGSEIKRRRELREQQAAKEADRLAAMDLVLSTESLQPEDQPFTLPKKYPKIGDFILGTAGFLVVVMIIIEAFKPEPTHRYSDYSSYTPEPPKSVVANPPSYAITADGSADMIVTLINSLYGNVCSAELNGFFSKTLKIDWTSRTNRFHSIKVIAEIGTVKEKLYIDGVRYFQFPNDAGTYNVIDWKTGGKESISDRAPYYFSN